MKTFRIGDVVRHVNVITDGTCPGIVIELDSIVGDECVTVRWAGGEKVVHNVRYLRHIVQYNSEWE